MQTTLTTGPLTNAEAAAAGGIIGAMFMGAFFFALAWYIISVIATWRIFKKAGEPGWKAIIPIYNYYIMYKIVGMSGWFWAEFIIAIVSSIIFSVQGYNPYAANAASYDVTANPLVMIAFIALIVFTIVVSVINSIRTSHAFNHGAGFAVGLFFLQPIFWLILGFGSSKYNKKKALAK